MSTRTQLHQPAVTVAGRTDVGRFRPHNEDAYLVAGLGSGGIVRKGETESILFIGSPPFLAVADGVGGAASGEIASLMATDSMLIHLRRQYERGMLTSVDSVASALREAVAAANHVIHMYATTNPQHHGMATTATVAVLFQDVLIIAQVGDSRAYLIRDHTIRQITKDQSLVQRLVDAGELTAEEAATSDRRNIILQALGSESAVMPDLYYETPQEGDILILCSDGLSNEVGESDLMTIATRNTDMSVVCRDLISAANEQGGHDNITVVAARFDSADVSNDVMPVSIFQGFVGRVRQWLG
jgi:protein phosphatase